MKDVLRKILHRGAASGRGNAVRPRLVAIVGPSGSGKTWLAKQFQAHFGKEAAYLSSDDFYRDRSGLSPGRCARINFDHPRALDWGLFEHALEQAWRGRPIEVPAYNFATHARERCGRAWQPRPLVFVEGLWLLRRPAMRRLFDLCIFIDCTRRLQLERRLLRDTVERGRSERSVRAQFRQCVAPMCQRFVLPQFRYADVVVRAPIGSAHLQGLIDRVRQLSLAGIRY